MNRSVINENILSIVEAMKTLAANTQIDDKSYNVTKNALQSGLAAWTLLSYTHCNGDYLVRLAAERRDVNDLRQLIEAA